MCIGSTAGTLADSVCLCVNRLEDEPCAHHRGDMVSLFSCARAPRVKSCRLFHTHNETEVAGARALGTRFSHSQPVLHPYMGPLSWDSLCHCAQSGWPLLCSIFTIIFILKYEDTWSSAPENFRFGSSQPSLSKGAWTWLVWKGFAGGSKCGPLYHPGGG